MMNRNHIQDILTNVLEFTLSEITEFDAAAVFSVKAKV
jgi:hypothetical protein